MSKRGSALVVVIVVLLLVIVLLVGGVYVYANFLKGQLATPTPVVTATPVATAKASSPSPSPTDQMPTTYQNPFDSQSQAANPFASSDNPFSN